LNVGNSKDIVLRQQ